MKTLILTLFIGLISQWNFAQMMPDSLDYEYVTYVHNPQRNKNDALVYSDGRVEYLKGKILEELLDKNMMNNLNMTSNALDKIFYQRKLLRMSVFLYLNKKNYELINTSNNSSNNYYGEYIFRRKKANLGTTNN